MPLYRSENMSLHAAVLMLLCAAHHKTASTLFVGGAPFLMLSRQADARQARQSVTNVLDSVDQLHSYSRGNDLLKSNETHSAHSNYRSNLTTSRQPNGSPNYHHKRKRRTKCPCSQQDTSDAPTQTSPHRTKRPKTSTSLKLLSTINATRMIDPALTSSIFVTEIFILSTTTFTSSSPKVTTSINHIDVTKTSTNNAVKPTPENHSISTQKTTSIPTDLTTVPSPTSTARTVVQTTMIMIESAAITTEDTTTTSAITAISTTPDSIACETTPTSTTSETTDLVFVSDSYSDRSQGVVSEESTASTVNMAPTTVAEESVTKTPLMNAKMIASTASSASRKPTTTTKIAPILTTTLTRNTPGRPITTTLLTTTVRTVPASTNMQAPSKTTRLSTAPATTTKETTSVARVGRVATIKATQLTTPILTKTIGVTLLITTIPTTADTITTPLRVIPPITDTTSRSATTKSITTTVPPTKDALRCNKAGCLAMLPAPENGAGNFAFGQCSSSYCQCGTIASTQTLVNCGKDLIYDTTLGVCNWKSAVLACNAR